MRHVRRRAAHAALACLPFLAAAVARAQTTGDGGSDIEKCSKPIGTLTVVEPQSEMIYALRRYDLQSPAPLLRIMAQQSNCFRVVERGVAMQNIQQERQLAESGELQQGSNMGKGQMRTADYVLTPTVLFNNNNAGGVGGALGGFGRHLGVLGAVAGGLKFKTAETTITIADVRTSEQVAAAQGKAKKTDFALGAIGWGGGAVGALGGYTNTAEGKVVAASYLDNFNAIVRSMRADPSLQRMTTTAAGGATASGGGGGAAVGGGGAATATGATAGAAFAEGDVLVPKIASVKLLAAPSETARPVGTLAKTDELVATGEEKSGYVHVQGGSHDGWVRKALVRKQ